MSLKKNPALIAALVAAAAIAAYWFLVLTPKQQEAAQLQQQIATKRTELQTAQAGLVANQRAKASYKANYAAVARLGKAVPADADVQSLMVQLQSAADANHVSVDAVTVGGGDASAAPTAATGTAAATTPAGFTQSPFTFAFAGSYFSLSDFVDHLQDFVSVSKRRVGVTGRLLVVQSLQLSADGDGFPKIRADIGGAAYVLDGADAAAGATAAAPAGAAASTAPATPAAPTTTATVTGVIR